MMRLLIAEDDEVLRRELSRDLESHGYETAVLSALKMWRIL